jgi:hypothetical protein
VQRLLALGATYADVGQREVGWVVLADPEGMSLRPGAARDRILSCLATGYVN